MWTDEEIEILWQNRESTLADLKKLLPNRSESAIKAKRSRLQIRSDWSQKRWSHAEKELLQKYVGDLKTLRELLPQRSWESIRSQITFLRKRGLLK